MRSSILRILIVDDEPEGLSSLQDLIQQVARSFRQDIDPITARSGVEALRIIQEKAVDVLFIDYHLGGGMFGDEIIDHLNDPLGTLLVVLVSGRPERELEGPVIRRQRQLARRFRYLAKPVTALAVKSLYLEIQAFVNERPLPYPLARAKEVIQSSETNQGKVTAAKDLLETVIKYCTSIMAADAVRQQVVVSPRVKFKATGLTFGAWLVWLRTLLDQPPLDTEFIPEIRELFLHPMKSGQTPLQFISDFKEMRDQTLGHGHVHEEAYYESVLVKVNHGVQELITRLSQLARYPLVSIERVNLKENSMAFEFTMRALMGPALPPALVTFSSPARLYAGKVYVGNPLGDFLSVHPFITFCLCTQCTFRRIFVLDGFEGRQIVYNAACDHRMSSVTGYSDLCHLTSEDSTS